MVVVKKLFEECNINSLSTLSNFNSKADIVINDF